MQPYELLERELEKWTGCDNVVCCSSGTSALHLALESLQLPRASDVIVPDFAMIACARAVTLADMIPIVVDCRKDLNIDPSLIEDTLSKQNAYVCAIIAVHNYGRMCDMSMIHDVAAKYDLWVIEDMAEAHGCLVHPNTDIACWSFYKNKVVHGEEGGAVAFRSAGLAEGARKLRSMGFNEPHDYSHIPRGHNYRMSNCHAELIRRSLREFDISMIQRRVLESWYWQECRYEWLMPHRDSPWVYDLRIPGLTVERQTHIINALRAEGIAARHGFKPISNQIEYMSVRGIWSGEAIAASREVITLPLDPETTTPERVRLALNTIKSLV